MLTVNLLCGSESPILIRVVPSNLVPDNILHRHRMTPLLFPNQTTEILPVELWKLLTSHYILFRVSNQIQRDA